MDLLTDRLRAALRANAGAAGRPRHDPVPVVKFFSPVGAATWLATELDADGDTLFGLADLGFGCPELGSFSLTEIAGVRLPFGLRIERDLHFATPHPLSKWAGGGAAHRFDPCRRHLSAPRRRARPRASGPRHRPVLSLPEPEFVDKANMREGRKAPDVSDILPTIRARGVIQTLLVKPPNEEGLYGIVAGSRRFHAAKIVAGERRADGKVDPEALSLPCGISKAVTTPPPSRPR